MRSLSLTAALTLALYAPANCLAFSADDLLLQGMSSLPAYLYDPDSSQIPRRRPGHPVPERREAEIINPDNVEPAPIDAVGEFVPVPDRWR